MKPFSALIGVLYAFGAIARALPLFDPLRRLQQWPTEDGYFMLTMGRNVALGRGLSVAGGEMPTNGTQPLTTFVWALGYVLVGPERTPGVVLAQALQIVAAGLCAWGIYRLALRVLGDDEPWRAQLASALWFASPVVMPHTMNCLETGFYACAVAWIAWLFLHEEDAWSWKRVIAFGAVLGTCFWIRNDAAFLIAAICLVDLRRGGRARFPRILVYGAVSVLVASPWLVFNYTQFGHLMPVSGRAEALTGHLNIGGVPIVLTEYLMGVAIPHSISEQPVVIGVASAVVVAAIALVWRFRESFNGTQRHFALMTVIYVGGLSAFYGVYFGAAWFLPRYFAPTSPLLILGWVAALAWVWTRPWMEARRRPVAGMAALGLLALITLLAWRQHARGDQHMHFQVVAWVDEHVEDDEWVGAIQTGTLGFFHDRTINLDGKVNIAAYEALVAGREGEYVVDDTEIRYLVDWVGMRDWMNKPAIAQNFEVVEYDEAANLAVLKRR